MMSSGRACLLRLLIVAMLLPVASGFCAGSLPLQKRIGGGSCQQRLRPAAGLRNARASIGKIKKDGRADPEELQLQRRLGTVTVTVAMPLEEDFNLFERICMVFLSADGAQEQRDDDNWVGFMATVTSMMPRVDEGGRRGHPLYHHSLGHAIGRTVCPRTHHTHRP